MRRSSRRPKRSRTRAVTTTIKKGDRGSDVKLCQVLLNQHGFRTTVDGIFGSETDTKVRAFQVSRRLVSDGVVGPTTWAALQSTVNGLWKISQWPGTTDPGSYWLQNPSNVEGTAILVPGQYKDVWRIDKHNDQYDALCQRNGTVRVYRDRDKDTILEMDPRSIREGSFGINIHRSSSTGSSTQVDKWSAGCQVHATLAGFNEMMSLARKQVAVTGHDTFTYTLMEQW